MNDINDRKHTKQVIIDYYDSLVNQIDIYAEKLLEIYTDDYDKQCGEIEDVQVMSKKEEYEDKYEEVNDDLNTYSYCECDDSDDDDVENIIGQKAYEEKIYGIKEFTDPYSFYHIFDQHYYLDLDMKGSDAGDNKSTKVKISDYINDVRSSVIEEIRNVQIETLKSYELNKDGYKFDKDNFSEEMKKKKIFSNRFCFLLEINNMNSFKHSNRVFNMCAIITDFYLSETQLNMIKIGFDKGNNTFVISDKRLHFILDEKNLFLQYVALNIRYGLKVCNHEVAVLSISKETLLQFEKIEYRYYNIPSVYLARPTKIDFSSLKSLTIIRESLLDAYEIEVKHLGGLENLEYLKIKNMFINQRAFIGLNRLVKLVLDSCKADKLDSKTFISQRNLQFLKINNIDFSIRLNNVRSIRVLALLDIGNFKHIKTIATENLEVLHLNSQGGLAFNESEEIYRFFKRTNLTQLSHLRFNLNGLDFIRSDWFSGLTNLKRLCLANNKPDSLNFMKNINLSQIMELDLSNNWISTIPYLSFRGLKSLKWLDLSENRLNLKSGYFEDLNNLETLLLRRIKKLVIEKNSFFGLSSLKILDLSYCTSDFFRHKPFAIHPEAFCPLPELECLRLKKSKLKIKATMLPRLRQLKKIVLYKSDLTYYNFDKSAGLHFKVIE